MEYGTSRIPCLVQRCLHSAQGGRHGYRNNACVFRYPAYLGCTASHSISNFRFHTTSCHNRSGWSETAVHQGTNGCSNKRLLTRKAQSVSQISVRGLGVSGSSWRQSGKMTGHSGEPEQKEIFPSDVGMNMLVAVENDYLSWMRNTYISTLASLTMLNFEPVAGSAITATVGLCIAGMNVFVGSCSYIYNLSNMKQRGYVRWYRCHVFQLIALVHLVLWYCILVLLIPDRHMVEEDINLVEETGAKGL